MGMECNKVSEEVGFQCTADSVIGTVSQSDVNGYEQLQSDTVNSLMRYPGRPVTVKVGDKYSETTNGAIAQTIADADFVITSDRMRDNRPATASYLRETGAMTVYHPVAGGKTDRSLMETFTHECIHGEHRENNVL